MALKQRMRAGAALSAVAFVAGLLAVASPAAANETTQITVTSGYDVFGDVIAADNMQVRLFDATGAAAGFAQANDTTSVEVAAPSDTDVTVVVSLISSGDAAPISRLELDGVSVSDGLIVDLAIPSVLADLRVEDTDGQWQFGWQIFDSFDVAQTDSALTSYRFSATDRFNDNFAQVPMPIGAVSDNARLTLADGGNAFGEGPTIPAENTGIAYIVDGSSLSASVDAGPVAGPIFSADISPAPNSRGWVNQIPVEVTWTGVDPNNGEVVVVENTTIESQGEFIIISPESCTNNDCSVEQVTVKVDIEGPQVTITGVENGATVEEIPALSCVASDILSGATQSNCNDSIVLTGDDLTGYVATATVTDLAGNAGEDSVEFFIESDPMPECTIIGTPGNDRLRGTNGDDVICGLGGDDIIDGRNGNDILIGGEGNDTLDGGNGSDTLDGGNGSDSANGGNGFDSCLNSESSRRCES